MGGGGRRKECSVALRGWSALWTGTRTLRLGKMENRSESGKDICSVKIDGRFGPHDLQD